jgi:hypothetical protein
MAQSFGDGLQLVEVTTDELVRGVPKKQLWVAAAKPERAVTLVLAEVPEGWTAVLSDARLKPEEAALLKMQPGDLRELTRQTLSAYPNQLANRVGIAKLSPGRICHAFEAVMSDLDDWDFAGADDAKMTMRAAIRYLLKGATGGSRGDIVQQIISIVRQVSNEPPSGQPDPLDDDTPGG